MKTIYKILLLLGLSVILSSNVFSQLDTLVIEKIVAIDVGNTGRFNAIEIEFNQPVLDSDVSTHLDNDWYLSKFSNFSADDEIDYFETEVEYIANSDLANDKFIRLGINNPDGDMPDNTFETVYFRYDGGDDVYAYYTPTEYLVDTPSISSTYASALDYASSAISSVTSDATDPGTLNVSQTITFEIDVIKAELGLTVSPANYNGQPLGWTPDGTGSIYTGIYTVTETDPDQTSALQLTGVTLEDGEGNVSVAVDGSDIKKGIDANTPEINTVTANTGYSGDTLTVGEQITFTVTPDVAEFGLSVSPTIYNGNTLSWSTSDGITYTSVYTVEEDDPDLDSPLQLLVVELTDEAGNTSTVSENSTTINKGIDGHTPEINTVACVTDGTGDTIIVDDIITFTVTPVDAEDGLFVSPTTYNGQTLTWSETSPYVATYPVTDGNTDQWNPLELTGVTLTDTAGNVSTPKDGNDAWKIDANIPEISTVTANTGYSGDTLTVGEQITFTVTPDVAEFGLSVSPTIYNGNTLSWSTSDGIEYTSVYTVEEDDPDLDSPLQLLVVELTDEAGNTSTVSENSTTINKWIDGHTPEISTVACVTDGTGDTIIVDDIITFTVTPVDAEDDLRVSPKTYNGQSLTWSATSPYIATYTVTEGNPDQWSPLELTGVTLTDIAGNVSVPKDGDNAWKIDANTPSISGVSFSPESGTVVKIGEDIDVIITAADLEPDLSANSITINNFTIPNGDITDEGDGTYSFTYNIVEGHTDRSDGTAIPISFALHDESGNTSDLYTTSTADDCPGIDATRPVIDTIYSDADVAGTLKVDDVINFTIEPVDQETGLTFTPDTYNSYNLVWETSDLGITYEASYEVEEGKDDQPTTLQLGNVNAIDENGNSSSSAYAFNDILKTIDANSPNIDGFTVPQADMLLGDVIQATISVVSDTGKYILNSGSIAGFPIDSIVWESPTEYYAYFKIANIGYDIQSNQDYSVDNLVLSDFAGNSCSTYSKNISQLGDPIYTILPSGKVTGDYHVCEGDTVELKMEFTGSAPWDIELDDGSVVTPVPSITESIYYHKIKSVNSTGVDADTIVYKINQVTDVNGNEKINTGLDSAIVYVHIIPIVDITDPPGNQTYNVNADADTLTGSPVDGVFSGNGIVSSNNTFLPSSAGLGTWDIVYTYTVPSSGCSDSDTVEFEVIESDADIDFENDDDWRCDYETTFGVTAEVITNPSIIGALKLYGAPAAITDHGGNTATIDVQQLSAGTYEVTFEYTDGTFTTFTKSFTVEKVGDDINPINFTDLTDECEDYDTIFVDAVNLTPSGGDGKFIFSGAGGAFEYVPTDPNFNSGYFLPGQVSPGSYSLKYVYTTTNGCESDSVIKYFDVNALPNVSFTMNSVYNIDQGSNTIEGDPKNANGIFTPLSFMSNNGDGTAGFDPADAGIGTWWVKYTYEDANACVNADSMQVEVNEALGEITVSSGSFQYCYYGSSIDTLIGTPNPTDGSAGSFYIDDVLITPESDNKVLFDPQDYLSGDHTVKFEYNNGPTAYVVYKTINVDSIGNIYFTGLDLKYCENEDMEVELTAFYPGQDGVMQFVGNGITDDDVDNLGFFNPSDANLGDNVITYTFTRNYSSCQKTYNETTRVNKTPFVAFYPNEQCIVNSGDSVRFIADTLLTDSIVGWNWLFRNTRTSTDPSPKFSITPGYNDVSLELETKFGCFHEVKNSFYIGTRVELEFTFENECHGETVLFTLNSGNDPEDIDSLQWIFGGPGISDLSDSLNPTHQYTNPGAYEVIYEEYLKSCGRVADTVKITIRPSIDLGIGEYLEEFEDNSDITGWVIEDFEEGANNSWQWGEPVNNKISAAASGTNAFVTNLSDNYSDNEKGMITSPCFDFSSIQRPMMKMDFISYTEDDRDGAVIQYTKPNGDWATIGVPNDGVNWYNSYIITGEPADQQLGWTGEIVGDDNAGWQTAMYRLDELRGRAGVRFRIVFGSNGDFTDEGFAFDNIQFSERKRMVLLENFTNIMDVDANIIQEDVINPILLKDSLDVISLNYHTSFPTANTFNSYYPSGPSARALFYGVSAVPYSILDGGERQFDYLLGHDLTEADVHKRMLIDPQFDISVRQDIQSNNFVVSSTVKALEEMTGQNVIVYVAIVEKTVLDGSDIYNNVLRTMLPDAAGILVEQDWIVGDSVNVYQTWSIPDGVNSDSLITIVFVQDEDTKEIYQTAFTEKFSTITSVDEIIANIMGIDYMVYPNPVKEILTIKLYKSLTYDINVNVYNNVGALVKSDKLSKGSYKLELNTNDLPSGVYYLRLTNTDKIFSTKKIIKTE